MSDFATYDGFKDWLLGVLFMAVVTMAGLIRKLDIGEINRRLDKLESRKEEMEKRKER